MFAPIHTERCALPPTNPVSTGSGPRAEQVAAVGDGGEQIGAQTQHIAGIEDRVESG